MGHGGRRPGAGRRRGSKNVKTLEKEAAQQVVRKAIEAELRPLLHAAIKRAKGLSYLVTRDAKSGKFIRVTRGTLDSTTTAIEVWEKEPDVPAIRELFDRLLGKAKETVEGEIKHRVFRLHWRDEDDPDEGAE